MKHHRNPYEPTFNHYEEWEDERPTRRSRADIYHHRGPVSESGLDIRYSLDLTKIAMNPHPHTLAIVQRVTGVDMDDLIEELEQIRAQRNDCGATDLEDYCRERIVSLPGNIVGATELYRDFCRWFAAKYGDAPKKPPVPSQNRFGKWLRLHGFSSRRIMKGYVYCNVELKD